MITVGIGWVIDSSYFLVFADNFCFGASYAYFCLRLIKQSVRNPKSLGELKLIFENVVTTAIPAIAEQFDSPTTYTWIGSSLVSL